MGGLLINARTAPDQLGVTGLAVDQERFAWAEFQAGVL
jgi:hypothetical protein